MNHLIFTEDPVAELSHILDEAGPERVLTVTDTNTSKLCKPLFDTVLGHFPEVTIEAGEAHKGIGSLQEVWRAMVDAGLNRRDMIVNIGGGTVTDLGGFAAATYMRGIRYINIPTTLLAAVDASTGGKTAIDFMGIKNLIGAFHSPPATIVSPQPLATLPREEMLSGWGEMIKHALLDDDAHLDSILSCEIPDAGHPAELLSLICRSVAVKSRVVAEDPTEKGVRRCLNLGHTAGHALESLSLQRGTPISHGHAIALGLLAELRVAPAFPEEKYRRLRDYILSIYRVPPVEAADIPQLTAYMRSDKKNLDHGDEVAYIAMNDVGHPDIYATAPAISLAQSLADLG